MHQTLHLGGGHFHKEAIALDTTDHPRQHLTHQGFRLAGLGHGQQVAMEFGHEPAPSVEPLGEAVIEGVVVGRQGAWCQQGPIDRPDAGIGGEVHAGFVTHAGAVFAFAEQQRQHLLIPQIGVMEAGEAPGRQGRPIAAQAGQGMLGSAGSQLHGFEGCLQLLLQGAAPVGGGEGGGEFGGIGIALLAQFQGDLQGQGCLGHIVEVAGIGRWVGRKQRGQLQGREVLAQGPIRQQRGFAQQGHRVVARQLHKPALQGAIRTWHRQIPQALKGRVAQGQINRARRQAPLLQQRAHGDQVLEQGQLVLEALEGRWQRPALGFAFGQGHRGIGIDHRHGFDLASAEAVVLQGSVFGDLQRHREGRLGFPGFESRCLGQGCWQQGQPLATHAEGFRLIPQPEIEVGSHTQPLSHRRAMQPEGPTALALLEGQPSEARGVLAVPALGEQHLLGGEVGALFGGQGLEGGPGGGGALVQVVLGEQQIQIGGLATVHR